MNYMEMQWLCAPCLSKCLCVQTAYLIVQSVLLNRKPGCLICSVPLQDLEGQNADLEQRVQAAEQTLASSREEHDRAENEVRRIIGILDMKIGDLNDIRQSLAKLVDK